MPNVVTKVSFSYQSKNNSEKIKNDKKKILKNIFKETDINLLKDNCKKIFSNKINMSQDNDSINTICTQRNYFSSPYSFTKSMVDYAIITFIKDIINKNNDFTRLIEIFSNPKNFKSSFIKFLKSLNVNNIEYIPQSYLNIKYLENIAKIKLNNIDLDLKQYNFKIINNYKAVKNKTFRDLTQGEIEQLKTESKKYFVNKVNHVLTSSGLENKTEMILQLTFFLKATNLILRKFTNCSFNFNDFKKFAGTIFDFLNITAEQDKFDFLNYAFILNFHKNIGLYWKRALIQTPLIIATSVCLCITVFGAIYIAKDWFLTMIGAAVEGAHDLEGVGNDMIIERLGLNFNAGDRLYSYTDGMQSIFNKLSIKYQGLDYDGIELNEKIPSNNQLYKLLNSELPKQDKLNCLINVMKKLSNEGATIRNSNIDLIDII